MEESALLPALEKLLADGYIKIFYEPPEARQPAAAGDSDLDFTLPQAVAQLSSEAETRAKAEAEAKARAAAAALAAAEARARQEAFSAK